MDKKTIVAGAVSLIVGRNAVPLTKANAAVAPNPNMEKCYGIAKSGKNDCASKGTTGNSCQGQSKMDSDPHAWIYVPKGTCERIVNGSLTEKNGTTTTPTTPSTTTTPGMDQTTTTPDTDSQS